MDTPKYSAIVNAFITDTVLSGKESLSEEDRKITPLRAPGDASEHEFRNRTAAEEFDGSEEAILSDDAFIFL